MKLKLNRIICLVMVLSLCLTSASFAAGSKNNTKAKSGAQGTVLSENDILYINFTDTPEGETPQGWSITNDNGYVDTEAIDDGKGNKKNMLRIVDTSHDNASTGPTAIYRFSPVDTGIVKYETRFKYVPDGTSTHSLMNFTLRNASDKNIAVGYIPPSGGSFVFRDTSTGAVSTMKIEANTWHTLTFYLDLKNGVYDGMIKNEAKDQAISKLDLKFASDLKADSVAAVRFRGESYGGIYYIDYVRVSKETIRLEDALVAAITDDIKGFPAEMIDAPKNNAIAKRTNIKYNGKYMFTTLAPIVSGDEVLVTLKNIATMFNMAYLRDLNGYVIKNDLNTIFFAADGSSAKLNNSPLSISAPCQTKGIQLYVPISDVSKALGLDCSFDKENNEVIISGKVMTKADEKALEKEDK